LPSTRHRRRSTLNGDPARSQTPRARQTAAPTARLRPSRPGRLWALPRSRRHRMGQPSDRSLMSGQKSGGGPSPAVLCRRIMGTLT
jgi:hypothetical protein